MPIIYGKSTFIDKNNWICKHCEDTISEETDNSIECLECSGWYHVECTMLDRKKFMEIVKSNQLWYCHLCPKDNETEDSNISYRLDKESSICSNSQNEEIEKIYNIPKCVKCLNILSNSAYQEIFNEIGNELELQMLLLKCCSIDIKENENELQALCCECVSELTETYNLEQNENDIEKLDIDENTNIEILSSEDEEYLDIDTNTDNDNDSNDGEEDDNIMRNTDILDDTDNKMKNSALNITENTVTDSATDNDFEVFYLDDFDEEFNFKAYKKKVIINHKFDEIVFPDPIKCKLCSKKLYSHVEMLKHVKEAHVDSSADNTEIYHCVINETCTLLNSFEDFSYHIIFKHYDFESLVILAECPECNQFFENFLDYNKHCCDTVKRHGRRSVECEQCGKCFKSNKRYRFHLQFHLEKRRPKACFICDTMFRDEDEFFEHVKYEHDKNIANVCRICDLIFSTEENLKNHNDASHNKEAIYCNCTKCGKQFSSMHHLKQHMAVHEDTFYKCEICGKYLTRKSRLNKHLMQHQKPVEMEVMSCNICGFVSRNEDVAESHLLNHNEEEAFVEIENLSIAYTCEYCDEAFNNMENLFKHRKQHPPNQFICNLCNIIFNKYGAISTHRQSHVKHLKTNNEFPVMKHYVCGISECKKSYPLWTALNMHRLKYHRPQGISIFCCPKCKLDFKTKFDYSKHLIENHKGKKIFKCQFCQKSCRTRSALKGHARRVHKKYKECFKEIEKKIEPKKIKIEKVIHSKKKNDACRVCGKLFFCRSEALNHEKAVHDKEAKYFCTECTFKTPYRQTLVYHMQTHKDEYPFQCSICSRKFRFKNSHKLHEQRHQNYKTYSCNIDGCNMSYINAGRLKTHQRLKHSPNVKPTKSRGRPFLTSDSYSDVFIDDDDGLCDGEIGESSASSQFQPSLKQQQQKQRKQQQKQQEQYQQKRQHLSIQPEATQISNLEDSKNFIAAENVKDENICVYTDNFENEYYTIQEITDKNENDNKPVLIIRNNDYIMELDDNKIYGNALDVRNVQETEIGAVEIVGE